MSRANLETHTGLYFDYLEPLAEQVTLDDVAHALSHVCRFGGHTTTFYSVAEHAVLVAALVDDPALKLAALHHDSHEAYLGDLPTPLKREIGPAYRRMREAADRAIGEAFGIDPLAFHHIDVITADALALRMEAAALKRSRGIGPHWGQLAEPHRRAPWTLGHPAPRYLFKKTHKELTR